MAFCSQPQKSGLPCLEEKRRKWRPDPCGAWGDGGKALRPGWVSGKRPDLPRLPPQRPLPPGRRSHRIRPSRENLATLPKGVSSQNTGSTNCPHHPHGSQPGAAAPGPALSAAHRQVPREQSPGSRPLPISPQDTEARQAPPAPLSPIPA